MKKGRIKIEDANDFCLVADDMVDYFLEQIIDNPKYTRPVNDDDPWEAQEGASFMYTDKGNALAVRYINRLSRIGEKYWPGEISINPQYYTEF